ncbi:LacI family DNA-binding transcriptional regulator [Bacillus sp. MUM 13]|uniref:LacI family DNA-binding transcriptional regulator n=1 Tax=Bacillus sp. MUM 13 TaxID=1678001 RepID=UPI0008F56B64|nr:LacI family DNA-binding transcriptional regulator [Bacillus sp. MUM 13]OIK14787.1 LacI family transcriptional regulator [Bacillus sp. MUM 13]
MTTIKDIAKAAGVSVTTVSRALNGYSDVSENTRRKVAMLAKELNYSPNTLARSLVMKKSMTIGLLVNGINQASIKDNFTFEVLAGINEYVSKTNYDLVLFSTTSTKQREKSYSQLCRERRVDGVIISGIRTDDSYLQEILQSEIPCVLIDIPIKTEKVGYVTADNKLGANQAVSHLLQLGHRNIAFVNGHKFAFVSEQRLEGYLEALGNAKVPIREEWIVNGNFNEDTAEAEALLLLKNYPDITAIFSASDLMALGILKAAKTLGIKVPQQLSVIGYDDILLSSYVSPALTTIAQNKYKMGQEAVKLLIATLEGREVPQVITLETELKIRETTCEI